MLVNIQRKSTAFSTYCAASVGHVVDENGDLVLDITDENHAADLVGSRALLVDESEARVEAIGNRRSTLGAACIGRDDDDVLLIEVLADPAEDGGLGVEIVHGDVEEALDLRGVEIHGDHMVLPRLLIQFPPCEFRRTGRTQPDTWSMFAMSLAEIGARDLSFLSCRA